MTTQEHLELILAFCRRALEVAEKRTPGEWFAVKEDHEYWVTSEGCGGHICEPYKSYHDAAFIASAAGPFEAALKSTIAAIDLIHDIKSVYSQNTPAREKAHSLERHIIAAWPLELLQLPPP